MQSLQTCCVSDYVFGPCLQLLTCNPSPDIQSNSLHAIQLLTCNPTPYMQSNSLHAIQLLKCNTTLYMQYNSSHAIQLLTCNPTTARDSGIQHTTQLLRTLLAYNTKHNYCTHFWHITHHTTDMWCVFELPPLEYCAGNEI